MPIPVGSETLWPAPAKLNLFLHVLGRRPDGYHDIQTLFQLLDWGDELRILTAPGPEIVRAGAAYPVAESEDLAVRAARRLQAATGCAMGAVLEVNKRIPLGAGLGGGSSNAATVLLVLNRLWGCGLDVEELAALGLELGADVPVFIFGHSALATGIGEELRKVSLGERHYLLAVPDCHVSTAEVFSSPALKRDSKALGLSDALAGRGRNDCAEIVLEAHPVIAETSRALEDWGQPRLTGTGAAVFVPMADAASALGAARELKCRYNVRAVRGVDRSPLHDMLESGI